MRSPSPATHCTSSDARMFVFPLAVNLAMANCVLRLICILLSTMRISVLHLVKVVRPGGGLILNLVASSSVSRANGIEENIANLD